MESLISTKIIKIIEILISSEILKKKKEKYRFIIQKFIFWFCIF
jgi:hypothetical protein